MTLNFTKNEHGTWIAEFEVTADFNLHIEREKGGDILLYQKTSGGGYDIVDGFGNQRHQGVIDYDCTALVYPKWIKIVSEVEPTYATVMSDGEVTEIKAQSKEIEVTSNGTTEVTPDAGFAYLNSVKVKTNVATSGEGGGSASSWRYFDISKLDSGQRPMVIPFIVKLPVHNLITAATTDVNWADVTAFGVDDSPKLYTPLGLVSWSQMMAEEGLTPEVMAQEGIVEITEEEFYTLDNGGGIA